MFFQSPRIQSEGIKVEALPPLLFQVTGPDTQGRRIRIRRDRNVI